MGGCGDFLCGFAWIKVLFAGVGLGWRACFIFALKVITFIHTPTFYEPIYFSS